MKPNPYIDPNPFDTEEFTRFNEPPEPPESPLVAVLGMIVALAVCFGIAVLLYVFLHK